MKKHKTILCAVITLSALLLSTLSFTNPKKFIDFNITKQEVKMFIKKSKEASVLDGKYNVYAIKFTIEKQGYCTTFGYVSGPIDVPDLKNFMYYFYSDSELVVVNYPVSMKEKYVLMNNNLQLLKDRSLIYKKISKEPFLGTHIAYLCCYNSNGIKKTFYDSDENVPRNKAIIKYEADKGTLIKIDSTSLKKMIEDEK
ncbi:MAG: hypothetical protein JSU07_08950 [Bacteroidetes bacterium]|nr:hypothetical protein [Bacteroidota bacterium]